MQILIQGTEQEINKLDEETKEILQEIITGLSNNKRLARDDEYPDCYTLFNAKPIEKTLIIEPAIEYKKDC